MRDLNRFHYTGCLALLLLAPTLALAAEPATTVEVIHSASIAAPRFTLKSSTTETAAQQSSRYSVRARFAPVESGGELREGDQFTLIGRFAKAGVGCGTGGVIFSNGFEGN